MVRDREDGGSNPLPAQEEAHGEAIRKAAYQRGDTTGTLARWGGEVSSPPVGPRYGPDRAAGVPQSVAPAGIAHFSIIIPLNPAGRPA